MTTFADAAPSALAPGDAAPVAAPAAAPAVDVAVAATFTAEGLEAPLAFMLDVAGLAGRIAFAPYHQVFQELLTPGSTLARQDGGIGVVLLRLEDFVRDAEPVPTCPRWRNASPANWPTRSASSASARPGRCSRSCCAPRRPSSPRSPP